MSQRLFLFLLASAITLIGSTPSNAGKSGTKFSDGKNAASVIGQVNFVSGTGNQGGGTPGANTLNNPEGIAIDPVSGKVFIADRSNNRVLRFASAAALLNGANAEAVLGQADFVSNAQATTLSGMNRAVGVAIDNTGHLWVTDLGNHRVLRFDDAATKATGSNANGVLGQADFVSSGSATSQTGMDTPFGLAVDSSGSLWVADLNNDRVLRFDNAAGKANGAGAEGVLGKGNFITNGGETTQNGMDAPISVSVDAAGRLWVADSGNHRILRFDNAAAKADGANAEGVLGQTTFATQTQGTTASTMMGPQGVAADTAGRIWVADRNNHRVLRFDNAPAKANGAAADGVLGQPDLTSNAIATTQNGLNHPLALLAEGTRLWVGDRANHRVLRYETDTYQPDGQVGSKKGKQSGDGTYNGSGSGQKAKVTAKGNRAGKAFFTAENDGDVADDFTVTGTKGNKKLKVKYIQTPGGNVTAAMTRAGLDVNGLGPGLKAEFKAKISATKKSRGKRARRTLTIRSISDSDGEADTVKAKVKKTP